MPKQEPGSSKEAKSKATLPEEKANWAVVMIPECPKIINEANALFGMSSLFGYSQKFIDLTNSTHFDVRRAYRNCQTEGAMPRQSLLCLDAGGTDYFALRDKLEQGETGIYISFKDSIYPVISQIGAGSAAELAGISPGDKLLAIEGANASMLSLMSANLKLRGPVGSFVNLTVQKDNGKHLLLKLERQMSLRKVKKSKTGKAPTADFTIPIRGVPLILRDASKDSPVLVEFYQGRPDSRIDAYIKKNEDVSSDKEANVDIAGLGFNSKVKTATDLKKLKVLRYEVTDAATKDLRASLGVTRGPAYVFLIGDKEMLVADLDIVRAKPSDEELLNRMKSCVFYSQLEPRRK